ncbi:MAG: glycosyltransferase [Chloroflexota bacterium]
MASRNPEMLSVVCPVYNEADNIERLMSRLSAEVSVPMEVLIVYDFDDDNTIPVVQKIAGQYPFGIKLLKNKLGSGALNALKTGFSESHGEAALVVMADLSDDFSIVNEMYRLINAKGFDIVCGSRYMPGGKQIGGPVLKKFISRSIGLSLHYLTGIPTRDVTNSFKMYRLPFLQGIKIESTGGFEVGMELVIKAFTKGARITELPSAWSDRTAGQSRFRMWKWAPYYFRWYLYAFKSLWSRKRSAA